MGIFDSSKMFEDFGTRRSSLLLANVTSCLKIKSLEAPERQIELASAAAQETRRQILLAEEARAEKVRREGINKRKPNILEGAEQIATALGKLLDTDPIGKRLLEIIENQEELTV